MAITFFGVATKMERIRNRLTAMTTIEAVAIYLKEVPPR